MYDQEFILVENKYLPEIHGDERHDEGEVCKME